MMKRDRYAKKSSTKIIEHMNQSKKKSFRNEHVEAPEENIKDQSINHTTLYEEVKFT